MNTSRENRPGRFRFVSGAAPRFVLAVALTHGATSRAAEEAPAAAEAPKSSAIEIADVKRAEPVDFTKDVLPILRQNCTACHNPKDQEADLVLETQEAILTGGESGPAVVAGKPMESLLLRLSAKLDRPVMPPKTNKVGANPLTPQELGLLKLWIEQGAKASAPALVAAAPTTVPTQWQPLPEGLNPIYGVAVTEDGQLAACNRANQIFVYSLPHRSFLTRLTDPSLVIGDGRPGVAHRDLVQSLAFSPDGKLLASGGFREVKIWQRPDPAVRLTLASVAANRVAALATSADGKLLAVGGDDGTIRLFDLPDGKPRVELKGHAGEVAALRFSADGKKLYSGSLDKSIRTWNVADGAAVGRVDTPQAVSALLVAQSNETGERVVTAGGDGLLRLWSTPALPRLIGADVAGPITAVATTPDRKRVAVAAAGNAIRLVDVAAGTAGPAVTGHSGVIRSIDFDSTGGKMLGASDDGTATVWAVETGEAEVSIPISGGAVTAAAIRPDGKRFAAAVGEGAVGLWRLDAAAPRALGKPDQAAATVGVVSPNNQLLATAGTVDGKAAVLVRAVASGEVTQALLGAEGAVNGLAFSADGKLIAAGSADKTARVWSLADAKELAKFAGHAQPVTSVAFHPDSARVVSAAADGTVKLWGVADAKEVRSFPPHAGPVVGVAVLRGDQLVSVSADQTLNVFDLNTGTPLRSTLLAAPATALAVSRDGARVAVATADKKLRVLAAADGAEQNALTLPDAAGSISFSADGRRFAVTGEKRATVLDAATGDVLETVLPGGVKFATFAEKGDEVLVAREDGTIHATPLRFLATLTGGAKKVSRLVYAKDGATVFASSEDGTVRAFNAADGAPKYTATHGSPVRGLALSPDGQFLASGGDDAVIKLWTAATGTPATPAAQIGPLVSPPACLAFSADGRRIFGASTKADDAWVFDRESGAPLERVLANGKPLLGLVALESPRDGGDVVLGVSAAPEKPLSVVRTSSRGALAGHTGVATSLAAVPGDGNRFVSGGIDGTVRQWVLNSGNPERQFAHGGPVASVAVRADGKAVASSGGTFTKLWDAASGKEIATLRGDRVAAELAQRAERSSALSQAEVAFRNQKLVEVTARHAAETAAITQATAAKAAAETALPDKQAAATAKNTAKAAADAALAEALAAIDGATKAQAAAEKRVPEAKQLADAAAAKQVALADVAQKRTAEAASAIQAAQQAKAALDAASADVAAKTKAVGEAQAAVDTATAASTAAAGAAAEAKAAAEKAPADATLQAAAASAGTARDEAAATAQAAADALAAAKKAFDDAAAAAKLLGDAHAVAHKAAEAPAAAAKLATATLESAQKLAAEATAAAGQAVEAKTAADAALAAAKAKQPEADAKAKQAAAEAALAETALAAAAQSIAAVTKSLAEAQTGLVRTEQDLAEKKAAHALAVADAARMQVEADNAKNSVTSSEKPVTAVSFSPDHSTVVTAGDDGAVRTYSAETGAASDVLRAVGNPPVTAMAIAPDGSILSGAADRMVRCWTVNPPWSLKATIGTGDDRSPLVDRVLTLAFSTDGTLLATGGGVPSRSGELKLWSVATGQLFREFPEAHSDAVYGLSFSGDGTLLASGAADKFAKVWDVGAGTLRRSFEGHTGHVLDVSLRHDGRVLVTGGADSAIKIWDVLSGDQRPLANPAPSTLEVTSVAHVGFTDRFLVTTGDGAARLVREDLNVERNFDAPPAGTFLYAGAASQDGTLVLTGGHDSVFRIRDARDGKVVADLGPPGPK